MTFRMKEDERMKLFLDRVEGKIVTFDPMEFDGVADVLITREEMSSTSSKSSPSSPTSSRPSHSFHLSFETEISRVGGGASPNESWTMERTIRGNTTSYDDKNLWGGKIFKKRMWNLAQ